MNVTGSTRGLMSKGLNGEEFLKVVARTMEGQLKEWDENYEVMVMKLVNYEFVVVNNDTFYHIDLSEVELKSLQEKGPFSLDRKLWTDIQEQGLKILRGHGNYLDHVFGK